MSERFKAKIMDEAALLRTTTRISHEIIEKNKGVAGVCLVGIDRRGRPLAELLRRNIEKIEGISVPCGSIDISFYRDDLAHRSALPVVNGISLPFSVTDMCVVIVDDVLYTGRTVRAAIDAIFSIGRPRCVQLAILIDRGHRELPIRADYIGKSIPTSKQEKVAVCLPPYDAETGVSLFEADS